MRRVPITEVCDFQGGTQPPKSKWVKEPKAGYIRMLQIRDFTQPDKDNIEYVSLKSNLKICEKDDVLIGRYGASIGKILTGLQGAYNVAIIKTEPYEKVLDKKYLYYVLKSEVFQHFILNVGSRAAQAGFNKTDLASFKIPLPSLEEQKAIVAKLDRAQRLIEIDKAMLAKYDQLIQSVFLDMFGDPVSNPKGWEVKKLGDVCTKITDGTHDTPERFEFGVPLITGKNIRSFKIDYENTDFVSQEDHEKIFKRCNPEFGDVLYVNIGAGIGTAAFNRITAEFSMKNVALLKPQKGFLKGRYLESCLNNEIMKKKIIYIASLGGAQKFLGLSDIRQLKIPIPKLHLQDRFDSIYDRIEKERALIIEGSVKTEELFSSLVQEVFG